MIKGKYFFPSCPTFCLTIFDTNSYDNCTKDCILDGTKACFLTKKIEKKLIRITEITINNAEFVKEISKPPIFNSKYLAISN